MADELIGQPDAAQVTADDIQPDAEPIEETIEQADDAEATDETADTFDRAYVESLSHARMN
jgi:hypothetical protein